MIRYILFLAMVLSCASPALANETMSESPVRRFSLEAAVGTDFTSVYPNLIAAYRLPVYDDKIDLFANAAFGVNTQVVGIGSRLFLLTEGMFRPYLEARVGAGITPVPPVVQTSFQGFLGVGSDIMFTDNWGASVRFLAGVPTGGGYLGGRSEVGLKYQF